MSPFRARFRLVIIALLALLTVSYLYRKPSYSGRASAADESTLTKHLVVATTKKKLPQTAWVHEELPDWPSSIYVTDDPTAPLHTEKNKGNEANPFLTWIIDNYDALPDVTVFTHHHDHAPHIDVALGSNSHSIKLLRLSRVVAKGYQSLRCQREAHCCLKTPDFWNTVKHGNTFHDMWKHVWGVEGDVGYEPPPEMLLAPGFAQFAVSAAAIRSRPKEKYRLMHDWLMETPIFNGLSGRAFEYSWHYIFGKQGVLCLDQDACYCETYGLCNKNESRGWEPDPILRKIYDSPDTKDLVTE